MNTGTLDWEPITSCAFDDLAAYDDHRRVFAVRGENEAALVMAEKRDHPPTECIRPPGWYDTGRGLRYSAGEYAPFVGPEWMARWRLLDVRWYCEEIDFVPAEWAALPGLR